MGILRVKTASRPCPDSCWSVGNATCVLFSYTRVTGSNFEGLNVGKGYVYPPSLIFSILYPASEAQLSNYLDEGSVNLETDVGSSS